MKDAELLELAAKTAGIEVTVWTTGRREILVDGEEWNPLTDDGDALRLLAALPSLWELGLKFGAPSIEMNVAWGTGRGIHVYQFAGEKTDRASVIRRAIVLAAAEIAAKRIASTAESTAELRESRGARGE